ncbi:hypothetical protein [Faecalibacter rhinopitheci]|uniref:GLPGLI family protein n=1 Tax=Faecalibacter rhinopitheci TaxID=2779678 RepID=A0A8J7GA25_9FLAO|nr:hypothetical protein [Faecalibacter rhinopitheci]MBF0598325.1 hypothetical protein [Faecalibacter rhinopitheci]
MKYLISLIIVLLTSSCLLSQNTSDNYFVYEVKMNNALKPKNNDFIDYNTNLIEYELTYNNNQSLFKPISKLNNSQTGAIKYSDIFLKTQGEFFINESIQQVQNFKSFLNKEFIIIKNFDEFNWDITLMM